MPSRTPFYTCHTPEGDDNSSFCQFLILMLLVFPGTTSGLREKIAVAFLNTVQKKCYKLPNGLSTALPLHLSQRVEKLVAIISAHLHCTCLAGLQPRHFCSLKPHDRGCTLPESGMGLSERRGKEEGFTSRGHWWYSSLGPDGLCPDLKRTPHGYQDMASDFLTVPETVLEKEILWLERDTQE